MNDADQATPRQALTLYLDFDVDQQSDVLGLGLRPDSATPPPYRRDGRYAETLLFGQNEEFKVVVVGTGAVDSGFESFEIIDLAILSRPGIVQRDRDGFTVYAAPSPFADVRGACHPLAIHFTTTHEMSEDGAFSKVVKTWKDKLRIGKARGNWELSFALTVRIVRNDEMVETVRVFWCDPESEVGGPGTRKETVPQP